MCMYYVIDLYVNSCVSHTYASAYAYVCGNPLLQGAPMRCSGKTLSSIISIITSSTIIIIVIIIVIIILIIGFIIVSIMCMNYIIIIIIPVRLRRNYCVLANQV